ncbi:conserved hypothetical protein [Methylocella tundrae]|uniref:Immunity protein 74 n=1 Tax=Methylocella tundrae TaxID=227605 RepID=A0A8B6MD38_METTU|nr:Imm74 family immunity protein [Methylocella tundrae]VTZ27860.1 conserved hypothetical protein [Methylocella tundrae]VTZ52126.1 conserved hypothetical protein [Methylocella tundrae]
MATRRGGPRITLTEGAIRILWTDKVLTILPAAQPPDSEEAVDFVIDMDQIMTWDPPHQSVEIGVEELQIIMQAIEADLEKLGLVVAFE